MKKFLIVFSALLLLLSCKSDKRASAVDDDQIAIHDLVAVSGDTLIAAKWSGDIFRTFDGGNTWTSIKTSLIKNLSVDKNLRVWGISSWIGIHEASYSRIFFSDDLGETWQRFDFDVETFFPLEFVSEDNDIVQIVTWEGVVMAYRGGKPNELDSWKVVKDPVEGEPAPFSYDLVVDGDYRVVKNTYLEKKTGSGQWNQLMEISDISIAFDILQDSNSVYIAAGGHRGYYAALIEVVDDSVRINKEMDGVQSLGVRKDSHGRIWTFGDGGIFRLEGDELRKML